MPNNELLHYIPIIKGKLGEFIALQELTDRIKSSITPLIEVPPVPWDFETERAAKTINAHLRRFVPSIVKHWGRAAFIDTSYLSQDETMEDGTHPLTFILDQARQAALPLIPVTGLNRNQGHQEAIIDALTRDRFGVCVRIEADDLEDEDLDTALTTLIETFNLPAAMVDLIIDLKEIQKEQIGLLVRSVRDIIRCLPNPQEWRSLTLTATAVPQTMSGFEPNSVSVTSRVEWLLWTNLLHTNARIPRMPAFGDYTIVHPELLELDPRIMQLGAKIKYTYENDWIIVKGVSIRRGGSEQTHGLCSTIVGMPEYQGPSFSWGDRYISNCAVEAEGPGNQTTWVQVGVNHHITFVVKQLERYCASSGSPVV